MWKLSLIGECCSGGLMVRKVCVMLNWVICWLKLVLVKLNVLMVIVFLVILLL